MNSANLGSRAYASQDKEGNINLTPYSYFNALCDNPPMITFSTTNSRSEGLIKDTLYNVENQGQSRG